MPFLPPGYPPKLYQPPSNPIVVRKAPKLTLHDDLRKVIRSFAQQLPPEIFSDKNIFPCDSSVLAKLAQVVEPDHMAKRWYSGTFSLLPVDQGLRLVRSVNGVEHAVCEGDSAALFEYILKYCEQALPAFVYLHKRGFCKHPRLLGAFSEQLRSFRKTRALTPGLDRCSKVDEMTHIDQDSTYYKFPVIEYWAGGKTVWHLGSGRLKSTSQKALGIYERVICVDPALEAEGPNHKKTTWQKVLREIPEGEDIVSDVAFGDEYGMTPLGMFTLAQALYAKSDDRLVMVKLTLESDYPGIEGFPVSKVRPHNAEFVAVLEKGAGPLDEHVRQLRESAIRSNRERNRRMYAHTFADEFKPSRTSSRDLGHLMRQRRPELPARPRQKANPPDRTKMFCRAIGAQPGKRHLLWRQVCSQREIPEGSHFILPHSCVINTGPIANIDPGFNCPYISIRSVIETAKALHMAPHYCSESNQWVLRNKPLASG